MVSPGPTSRGVVERDAALVVEVPHRDVEHPPGVRRALVDVDRDGPPEEVHVPGRGADRRVLPDRAGAALDRPGRDRAAEQVQQVRGGGLLAEAALEVRDGHGAVAQPLGAVVPARAARRAREGASSAGPACRCPRPRRDGGGPCSGRSRSRRGGCSAPGRRAGCRRPAGCRCRRPSPVRRRRVPRPRPSRPCRGCRRGSPPGRRRRSRSTRRPGPCASSPSAASTASGSTLETMTWWTMSALSGAICTPLTELVGRELGVHEEAAVVVGAGPLRCLG